MADSSSLFESGGRRRGPTKVDQPADRDELREWLIKYAGVTLPDRACCEEHTSPLDAVWRAYSAESPRAVWWASRGFGGKCNLADERVLLPDGTRPRWRDLIDQDFLIHGPADDAPEPVRAVAVDNGTRPVLEVALDSGNRIARTLNHPVMVGRVERRHGGMVYVPDRAWKMVGDLQPNDLVLVPDRLPVVEQDCGEAVSDEMVFLVGFMLGDGSSGLYGLHSHQKHVPDWVFALPDRQVAIFLNALLAKDGSLTTETTAAGGVRGRISYFSISRDLIEGVLVLCHRLGIRTTLRERCVPEGRFTKRGGEVGFCRPAEVLDIVGEVIGKEDVCEDIREAVEGAQFQHGWRSRGAPTGYHWEKVKAVTDLGDQPTVSVQTETHTFCGPAVEHNSVALASLVYAEAITLGAEVSLLGGSLEQSQRVHQYLNGERNSLNRGRVFWESEEAPRHLLDSDPTKRRTDLTHGGSIEVLTASQKSVRGPHPQRLRGDEIDEMNQSIWDAAQGQAQESGGIREQTVGSSTYQNPNGTMTAELKEARSRGFPVAKWCWRCVLTENGGWLSREAAERKFDTITEMMRKVEYELSEPSVTDTLFDRDAINDMFSIGGDEPLDGGLNTVLTFEEPVPGATYATGADWGKSRDRSIIVTLRTDVTPARVVRYRHMGRVPFPQMVGAYNQDVKDYDSSGCHDGTGIGAVIDDYLEVMSEKVVMSGKLRSDLFGSYVVAVERGDVLSPRIEYMLDEHKFCTVGDVYGAGHPPDSVVAMAMAWRAATGLDLLY